LDLVTVNEEQATSFGSVADSYDRVRPGPAAAALDWLVPAGCEVAVDLAAGTGLFTRALLGRAARVVAVEPDARMREVLARRSPGVDVREGRGEAMPLPDASADAVFVSTAWHWLDQSRAVPEIARVLRPGGRLGLVWNTRDERLGWVRELGEIIGSDGDRGRFDVSLSTAFTEPERHQVEWTNYLTPQALIDLVASRSYCITSPTEVRTRTLHQVRELLATHPALANSTGLALPYVTVCIRANLAK
jgi:SAM-dependent methyltransferase